ncbi:MAG: hypothetical protein JST39_18820 [Bacteroidetes bacterium]|nr:hypothetical protein [Bacteroidota bacterium]
MNNQLNISAILDEPVLLTQIVEELATCGRNNAWGVQIKHPEWKTMDTGSTEVYVSGKMALMGASEYDVMYMPFESSFLFTCTKERNTGYEMTWGISLS